nr:MAG TPA: hypothetical protein [Caudoviricetes sp.]
MDDYITVKQKMRTILRGLDRRSGIGLRRGKECSR